MEPMAAGAQTPGRMPALLPLAAAAVAVVLVGVVVGGALTREGIVETVAGKGGLVEVHLGTGVIVVGRFEGSSEGFLHLSLAATITSQPAASGQPAAFLVELLSVDPYDLAGEALIPHEQVLLVGPVAAGSSLEAAYRQAIGGPIPTPSP